MILIDAYNFRMAAAVERSEGAIPSIRHICRLLAARRIKDVILVLDGSPKPDEPKRDEFPDIKLRYSGKGIEADEVIGNILDQMKDARRVEVVSDDKQVRLYARNAGAKPLGCNAFLNRLKRNRSPGSGADHSSEPPEKFVSLAGAGAADAWMAQLGLTGDEFKASPVAAPIASARPKKVGKKNGTNAINPDEIDMDRIFRGL